MSKKCFSDVPTRVNNDMFLVGPHARTTDNITCSFQDSTGHPEKQGLLYGNVY